MKSKALKLAALGLSVFPVQVTAEGQKIPLTPAGHLDSSTDPTHIEALWDSHPEAEVGVHTGASGVVVLDIDVKNDIDGFESLGFEDVPATFDYETPSGGWHYVYLAPEGVQLNGVARYRGMLNVDRRGGSSWVAWHGVTPESRGEFTDAPEWLCDPARVRSAQEFEGDLKEWFATLVPGEPSAAVRRTMASLNHDMSHSEMVAAQHHAIRLGAEGHPGVPELLEALEEAWLNRPAENHTTPESKWEFKFIEALDSGIAQFGDHIEILKNLTPFKIANLPASAPTDLFVGAADATKAEWSKAMHSLIDAGLPEHDVVSVMWGAPRTRFFSLEWGIQFVQKRVRDALAKESPNSTVEVSPPVMEPDDLVVPEDTFVSLLTDEERERVQDEVSFIEQYLETGRQTGFVNEKLSRAAAWTVLSMAAGFKMFITPGGTDTIGLNMWFTTLAYSGTGKTRAAKFQETVMNIVHDQDNLDQPFRLSGNISPQGLHIALLERDRLPTIMFEDEAAAFFRSLMNEKWMQSMAQDMSHFYEGYVGTINKVSQAHLKGKSGMTSFNVHLYSTPENFFELVTEEQFLSGFLARTMWVLGEEREYEPNSIQLTESRTRGDDVTQIAPLVSELGVFLRVMRESLPESMPVHSSPAALHRQSEAANKVWDSIQGHSKFNILEPSARRIAWEYIRKASALMAVVSGYTEVQELHVLQALEHVEEWVADLFRVAEHVNRSVFYRQAMEIVAFIASRRGSKATEAAVYKRFADQVQRDPRELQAKLDLMIRSGRLVPETVSGGGLVYRAV